MPRIRSLFAYEEMRHPLKTGTSLGRTINRTPELDSSRYLRDTEKDVSRSMQTRRQWIVTGSYRSPDPDDGRYCAPLGLYAATLALIQGGTIYFPFFTGVFSGTDDGAEP